MLPKLNLRSDEGDLLPDVAAYRRLIGKLLYLTLSRPEIMFTVHKLSQFVACPRLPHLEAAHHLLRYLKSYPGVHAWILANLLQDIVFSLGIL